VRVRRGIDSTLFAAWLSGMALLTPAPATAAAPGDTLVVHLPSVPIDSSTRLASALTSLRDYLARVASLQLEVKIFRRWEDASQFCAQNPASIKLVLSEPSFLLDLPADAGFVPEWRFYRSGSETYRQVLVVRTEDASIQALPDLKGKSLQFVKTTGEKTDAFLERAVFAGEMKPKEWFGSMEAVPDDFSAVADLLHGQVDSALVADYNPLLVSALGDKLRAVFTSQPLSLPVLAVRAGAYGSGESESLEKALEGIGGTDEGRKILKELGVDALRPVASGSGRFDREALLRIPSLQKKAMEIALPSIPPESSEGAPSLAAGDVTFALAIELPEIPPVTRLPGQKKVEP
jgi:ABC-type phosphate/phosphonate transport system substrate-binding protein